LTVLAEAPFEERYRFPGHWSGMGGGYYDPYYGGGYSHHHPHYEPPYTLVTRGTRQTVRIDDRAEYVGGESSKGIRRGTLAGALAGAILGAVLGSGVLAAAVAGAVIGGLLWGMVSTSRAKSRPEIFKRDVNISSHREY
jgi:hypothetical protein